MAREEEGVAGAKSRRRKIRNSRLFQEKAGAHTEGETRRDAGPVSDSQTVTFPKGRPPLPRIPFLRSGY